MSVKAFRVVLPWPPTVNHYWGMRVIPLGGRKFRVHRFISRTGEDFRKAVIADLKRQFPNLTPLDCRLCILIELCPPTRATRDLDNFSKGPLDALKHAGVYVDDSQIDDHRVIRGPVVKDGCCKITLWKHASQPIKPKELFR